MIAGDTSALTTLFFAILAVIAVGYAVGLAVWFGFYRKVMPIAETEQQSPVVDDVEQVA
ncbi:MAG: hypothetical protein JW854_14630 [Actinobacteria bacterium]|nr:hypothetical protein [Actinomycetota bacterium]